MQNGFEMLQASFKKCKKIGCSCRTASFLLVSELFASLDRSLSELLEEFLKCE